MQLQLNDELEKRHVEWLKGIGFTDADFVAKDEDTYVLSEAAKKALQKAADKQLSYSQENSYPYLQNAGEGTLDQDLKDIVFEKAKEMLAGFPDNVKPTDEDLKNYLEVNVDASGIESENISVDVKVSVTDQVFSNTELSSYEKSFVYTQGEDGVAVKFEGYPKESTMKYVQALVDSESAIYNDVIEATYWANENYMIVGEMISSAKESHFYVFDLEEMLTETIVEMCKTYFYQIHLNERGSFHATVETWKGDTVYTLKSEGGELSQVEDGFMDNYEDVSGLEKYLKSINIIPDNAEILAE